MSERRAHDRDAAAFEAADYDLSILRRVEVRRGKAKSSLAVRFDADDLDRLRQRAEAQGIGVTQLVRRWVLDRLDEPDEAGAVDELMDALDKTMRAARAIKRQATRRAG